MSIVLYSWGFGNEDKLTDFIAQRLYSSCNFRLFTVTFKRRRVYSWRSKNWWEKLKSGADTNSGRRMTITVVQNNRC